MDKFDILVIGGGPAAITIAKTIQNKMKVGIIRPEDQATATSRDTIINQHVTAAPDFDTLGRGNSGKCSTNHSNGSSNFVLNSR